MCVFFLRIAVILRLSLCRDSLLDSSSKGLDLGLKLEVIEEQDKVSKSKEQDAEDEGHK